MLPDEIETTQPVDEGTPSSAPSPSSPASPPAAAVANPIVKRWYVVKVQSSREDSIKDAIERRIKIEGLEDSYGQIVIPVEKVQELMKGKRVTRTRKLYPGYLFVEVEFNEKILYLFRETPGVGDFVGATPTKPPLPMRDEEVQRLLGQREEVVAQLEPTSKIKFEKGDHVKAKDGMFAGMEGEVSEVFEAKAQVRVMLKIFGRDVPVDLEYWQVEHV
jgi:transcriptional antiterminator NusG